MIDATQRLRFRLLSPMGDAPLLYALDQDPQVMRFITHGEVTSWSDICTVFSPRLAAYTNHQKGWGLWGVFLRESDAFLGWILVRPMGFFTTDPAAPGATPLVDCDIELGWRFKRSSWGKGIATEAARHVMHGLRDKLGYRQFSAVAVAENTASIAIMRKLGMRYISSGLHRDPLGDMHLDTYSVTFPPE